MSGKWRVLGGALMVALSVSVSPLQAQRGQGRGRAGMDRPGGPNMGKSVELALENQEELGLSQDQVGQLQEIQGVLDGQVAGLMEEMKGLRESLRAGEVDRDDGLRRMEALRGELITASAPLRGRVQEILTLDQHNRLQPMVRQGRPLGRRPGVAMGSGRGGSGVRGGGFSAPAQKLGRGAAFQGRPGQRAMGRAPRGGSRGAMLRSAPGQGWRRGVPIRRGPGGEGPVDSEGGGNLP